MSDSIQGLSVLFVETGKAHHQAFLATDGVDPDWALWYADYLYEPIQKWLTGDHTRTDLVVALVEAASEHTARSPDTPWAEFYAKFFCERYVCEDVETLALYYSPTCPFCIRVLRVIEELGIDVELRNAWANDTYRNELVEARGRATVPVLRCTSATRDRWMPESADIIRYLRRRFDTASNSAE
ncbi:MAG: glutathione S-transferase N-terminal domain-containing protein [Myxococcota bacterium]